MAWTFVMTDLEPTEAPGGYVQKGFYEPCDFFHYVRARKATPRELEQWRTERLIENGGPQRKRFSSRKV